MSLPSRNNLFGMGFSFNGEPFVQVVSKSGITSDGLNYSYLGEPFSALPVVAAGFKMYIGVNQVTKVYLGNTEVTSIYLGNTAMQ